jgi:hypothetical protein
LALTGACFVCDASALRVLAAFRRALRSIRFNASSQVVGCGFGGFEATSPASRFAIARLAAALNRFNFRRMAVSQSMKISL